jgi:hypothetical protein
MSVARGTQTAGEKTEQRVSGAREIVGSTPMGGPDTVGC